MKLQNPIAFGHLFLNIYVKSVAFTVENCFYFVFYDSQKP